MQVQKHSKAELNNHSLQLRWVAVAVLLSPDNGFCTKGAIIPIVIICIDLLQNTDSKIYSMFIYYKVVLNNSSNSLSGTDINT